MATVPTSTNLLAAAGSASVGKSGASGSGAEELGKTTPPPETSPFLLTTKVALVA
jgi:hypothetical protein